MLETISVPCVVDGCYSTATCEMGPWSTGSTYGPWACGQEKCGSRIFLPTESPEDAPQSGGVWPSHSKIDEYSRNRQESQRGSPEHRKNQSSVSKRLPAVDAVNLRFVNRGCVFEQHPGRGIENQSSILTSRSLSGKYRHQRLSAFEFDGYLVDRRIMPLGRRSGKCFPEWFGGCFGQRA